MTFDLFTLQQFYNYWGTLKGTESPGKKRDFRFYRESRWLQDSAVNERIEAHQGTWYVSLVFSDPKRPSTFIVRAINTCASAQKASIMGTFMRKTAAKDPRGTVKLSPERFVIYDN